jgi:hypothetical protein
MPSVNPIVPRNPRSLGAIAALVLFFLYTFGLMLLALGTTKEGGIVAILMGGLLLCVAVYHTIQWIRAARRE